MQIVFCFLTVRAISTCRCGSHLHVFVVLWCLQEFWSISDAVRSTYTEEGTAQQGMG